MCFAEWCLKLPLIINAWSGQCGEEAEIFLKVSRQTRQLVLRLREQFQPGVEVFLAGLSPADLYLCTQKIGRGKYSEVFDAINIRNSQPCVVKVLKPSKQREMQ